MGEALLFRQVSFFFLVTPVSECLSVWDSSLHEDTFHLFSKKEHVHMFQYISLDRGKNYPDSADNHYVDEFFDEDC